MIGQTISHYKILEKLGEGGMRVVYKALDMRFDRTVALKFLPPHVSAADETKSRFLQEAKAASALNHPNICTVHGVEEDADAMFIVMELVDGGTIGQKIPFPNVDDAPVALQIGEALQEARHGVGRTGFGTWPGYTRWLESSRLQLIFWLIFFRGRQISPVRGFASIRHGFHFGITPDFKSSLRRLNDRSNDLAV